MPRSTRPAPTPTNPEAVIEPASRLAVVGRGRVGTALAHALGLDSPLGRGADGSGFEVVILAVPDREIASAAAAIAPGPLVGHCSGLIGLEALAPHEAFGMHPLMTVATGDASFVGAPAAVEGSTPRALVIARAIAVRVGMTPFEIASRDRAAYHAAAAMASNYLTTLEDAAETLLRTTGNDRDVLLPLVRAAVENWATMGGPASLTGPISRGDEITVARERDAIAERCPELLPMFDALADATRALAARRTLS